MSKPIKVETDFNFSFKGVDGKEIIGLDTASKIVANLLYNGVSGKEDKLRNRNWALKLHNEGKLELEPKEMDAILEACERGQLRDGYYLVLSDLFDEKREEYKALKDAAKKAAATEPTEPKE